MTEHEAIVAVKRGCTCRYTESGGGFRLAVPNKECPFHGKDEPEKEAVVPKKYEAIRDKFISEGKPPTAAKTSAAKIYNATRKPSQAPVTGKHTGPAKKK